MFPYYNPFEMYTLIHFINSYPKLLTMQILYNRFDPMYVDLYVQGLVREKWLTCSNPSWNAAPFERIPQYCQLSKVQIPQ